MLSEGQRALVKQLIIGVMGATFRRKAPAAFAQAVIDIAKA